MYSSFSFSSSFSRLEVGRKRRRRRRRRRKVHLLTHAPLGGDVGKNIKNVDLNIAPRWSKVGGSLGSFWKVPKLVRFFLLPVQHPLVLT